MEIDLNYFTRLSPVNITSNTILFRFDPTEPALVDARRWLERELWGQVVGLNPSAELKIIELQEKEEFTPTLRETYEGCRLAIFPLRIPLLKSPRFLQEAMAMQLPVIITSTLLQCPTISQNMPGLKLGDHFVRADTTQSFAALAARLLEIRGPGLHLAQKEREYIESLPAN